MKSIPRNRLLLTALLFAILSNRVRAEQISNTSSIEARVNDVACLEKAELLEGKKGSGGGGGGGVYGGGGCGWGWGGPGGSSGGGGGGGGTGYWKCECKHSSKRGKHHKGQMRDFRSEEYRMREFGECTTRGRCRGMRLECPLNCGGPCLYDCNHTCKAYCKH